MNHAATLRSFARQLRDENRLSEALDAALAAEAIDPSAPSALQVALIYARMGRLDVAKPRFHYSARAMPNDIAVWTHLGECSLGLLDYAGALRAFEHVIALDKDATHPHGRRARALVARTAKQLAQTGARS